MEEELKLLEAKANDAYGAYKGQLDTKAKLKEEIKATMKELEEKQGNLSQYTERQAKATAAKADLEVQLKNADQALINKEQERQEATADKKTFEVETQGLKKLGQRMMLGIACMLQNAEQTPCRMLWRRQGP